MPAVTVRCPHCARPYSIDDSLVGRKARCKGCGQGFALTPTESSGLQPGASPPSTLTSGPTPTAVARALPLPETIGRFVVSQRLGSGAFGTVYRATDPVLGREVALKVPQPGLLQSSSAAERFLREARAAAQLRHPNIVTLFETGTDRGEPFLATEFIEGTTLAAAIGEAGLEPRRAAEIVAALAEALQYAHAQRIVHRDVKPANVMLGQDGAPHLMDFGLARIEGTTGEKLTQVGAIVGTPAYLAPEQAAEGGAEADALSDQYSLGVTLYELLTGKTPFSGPPEVVIYNLTHREIPPPRSLRREIPRDLETICLKAMARVPAERYANCQELADDLHSWLAGEPIRARRGGWKARLRRHRVAASLAASAAVGLLMLGGWMATIRPRAAAPLSALATDPVAHGELPGLAPFVPTTDRVASKPDADPPKSNAEKPAERPPQVAPSSSGAVKVAEKTPAKSQADAPPATQKAAPDPDAKLTYAERIQQADQAGKEGRWERAEVLLAGCPVESRGWEWYYCKRLSRFRFTTLKGHNGPVLCVAFSPDGKKLASGGQDATVRIWDEHRPAREPLRGHSKAVDRVAFTEDGRRVISLSTDNTLIEWDVESGKPLRTESKLPQGLTARDISEDGKWIAGATSQGAIKIWDARTLQEDPRSPPARARSRVQDLAFSPDGQIILFRTRDRGELLRRGTAREAAGKSKAVARALHNIQAMAIGPDGRYLATATPSDVTIADGSQRQPAAKLAGHLGGVTALAIDHGGKRLATGDGDALQLWDITTGEWTTSLQAHSQPLTAIRFSPDDRRVAAASRDGNLYVRGVADGLTERVVKLPKHSKSMWSEPGNQDMVPPISFSQGGAQIVLNLPGTIHSLDSKTFNVQRTIQGISENSASLDPNLVAYYDSGWIAVRDVTENSILFQTNLDGSLVLNQPKILVLDKYRLCVSGGVWDQRRSDWVWRRPELEFSDALKSGLLVGVQPGKTIQIVSAQTGDVLHTFPFGASRLHPDGDMIAIQRDKDDIAVWSIRQGRILAKFQGVECSFAPSGGMVAIRRGRSRTTFDYFRSNCLTAVGDLATGQIRSEYTCTWPVGFSPDGRRLISVQNSALVIRDTANGKILLSRDTSNRKILLSLPGTIALMNERAARDQRGIRSDHDLPGPIAVMNELAVSADGSSIVSVEEWGHDITPRHPNAVGTEHVIDGVQARIWVADRPQTEADNR